MWLLIPEKSQPIYCRQQRSGFLIDVVVDVHRKVCMPHQGNHVLRTDAGSGQTRGKGPEGLLDKRGKRKQEAEMNELERLRAANRLLEAQNRRLEMENAVLKKLEEIEGRCR